MTSYSLKIKDLLSMAPKPKTNAKRPKTSRDDEVEDVISQEEREMIKQKTLMLTKDFEQECLDILLDETENFIVDDSDTCPGEIVESSVAVFDQSFGDYVGVASRVSSDRLVVPLHIMEHFRNGKWLYVGPNKTKIGYVACYVNSYQDVAELFVDGTLLDSMGVSISPISKIDDSGVGVTTICRNGLVLRNMAVRYNRIDQNFVACCSTGLEYGDSGCPIFNRSNQVVGILSGCQDAKGTGNFIKPEEASVAIYANPTPMTTRELFAIGSAIHDLRFFTKRRAGKKYGSETYQKARNRLREHFGREPTDLEVWKELEATQKYVEAADNYSVSLSISENGIEDDVYYEYLEEQRLKEEWDLRSEKSYYSELADEDDVYEDELLEMGLSSYADTAADAMFQSGPLRKVYSKEGQDLILGSQQVIVPPNTSNIGLMPKGKNPFDDDGEPFSVQPIDPELASLFAAFMSAQQASAAEALVQQTVTESSKPKTDEVTVQVQVSSSSEETTWAQRVISKPISQKQIVAKEARKEKSVAFADQINDPKPKVVNNDQAMSIEEALQLPIPNGMSETGLSVSDRITLRNLYRKMNNMMPIVISKAEKTATSVREQEQALEAKIAVYKAQGVFLEEAYILPSNIKATMAENTHNLYCLQQTVKILEKKKNAMKRREEDAKIRAAKAEKVRLALQQSMARINELNKELESLSKSDF